MNANKIYEEVLGENLIADLILTWDHYLSSQGVYCIFFSQKMIFKCTVEVIINCSFRLFYVIVNVTKK